MNPRLSVWAALATVAVLVRCGGGPETAPDLSEMKLGMSYPALAALAGGQGEPIHDRGVRVLEWHYTDRSVVEATIHDGRLSGLEFEDGDEPRGRSVAAARVKAGVQSDMPEAQLRARLGDHPLTIDDTSDRECRWSYADGTLTAVFMRGHLERASWHATGEAEPVIWIEVTDPVVLITGALESGRRSDRYGALHSLDNIDDRRVADALVGLLRVETDRTLRGMAATLLADTGDPRASDLLLPDLEHDLIRDEIIDALARIGDARAEAALGRAQERVGNPATRRKIQRARTNIDRRIGRDWPPAPR